MGKKPKKKKSGNRKHGRNKRPVNANMSKYVRGVIAFEQYRKGQ